MISPWSSMKAFLSQQQQSHKASTPNDAEDINYAATACAYLNPNQDANLTTQQRIATELAGCDIMLSGYFNPEGGFRFIKGIKITRPLLTRDGEVVPEGHTRLSNIMIVGRTVPHTLHMYSHPYGSLEIGDLFKYLMNAVQELEVREGVFGIASLEDQISFCRIGGSFSRSSGVN
ncbi:hypothetical protein N431DRAFT_463932 [Stipitochalara longipes BDJ]|nr:hypothetical protein N431DRAFT_463932 [Stipitochalara longipes BDJ]